MPEHKHAPISLEDLTGKLQGRINKLIPEYVHQIQIGKHVKALGTDQGPKKLNPADYKGLDKLKSTLALGRAREKIGEVLPIRAQRVRSAVQDALTAVQTYQEVIDLKARGYLPETDPREFNETVTEAVGKVYRGTIIFPESQPVHTGQPEIKPIIQPQPAVRPELKPVPVKTEPSKPVPVSQFRDKALKSLDKFRAGGQPQQILNMISRTAKGLTKDEILAQMSFGGADQYNQLSATITKINERIGESEIIIVGQNGSDDQFRYVLMSIKDAPPKPQRKKKRRDSIRLSITSRTEANSVVVAPAQDVQPVPEAVEHLGLISAPEDPKTEYYRAKRAKWLAGKPVKRTIVPNPDKHLLPDGFRQVVPDVAKLPLTIDKLPWLKEGNGGTGNGNTTVSLALVTLSDTGDTQFYLGSYIHHRLLLEAAWNLNEDQSDSVNQLFYSCLPDIVRNNYNPKVKTVRNPRGSVSILSTGNKAGQRVYFMRFDSIGDLPVFVKVAVCDKERQDLVFSVLTTQDHKNIKKLGKLN